MVAQLQSSQEFQSEENQVEQLRQKLNYPLKQKDPLGSRFWFLRPGKDKGEAVDTCPIAVSFYDELNDRSDSELKKFLASEQSDRLLRNHYLEHSAQDQPVMYLLLPTQQKRGRWAFVLPTETKLRQRCIKTLEWNEEDLENRVLKQLNQKELDLTNRFTVSIISRIPQIDWIFCTPAKTAKELAIKLAEVTRDIERAILLMYKAESKNGYLHKLLESFKKELLPNLQLTSDNEKDYSFADIYAQTITYGLFTARVFSFIKDPHLDFNRQAAWEQLPATNPFLRQLFKDISEQPTEELGDDLADSISEVIAILRAAKMKDILADFRSSYNREDIVIRFYEDFLAAYKPQMREKRGVYYTPIPVVSYIVRSVDELLKDKFNKPLGLADPEVQILDPACETGTFILYIFQLIHQRFQENPDALTEGLEDKSWSGYVRERLLPRVFGFELLMAPYAICHLKLGLFLEETRYKFENEVRLGVYLTNTLDDSIKKSETLFEKYIAEESNKAAAIKKDQPVMVIVGNPPYSSSIFEGDRIMTLMKDYKRDLNEKKLDLNREEWKFIKFAQDKIDRVGKGIMAFIINNTFVDGLTHRSMRKSLVASFNELNILNLHGSVKGKSVAICSNKDENIFDIKQGVMITLGIKEKKILNKIIAFSEFLGLREEKNLFLSKNNIKSTNWINIDNQQSHFLFFCPKDLALFKKEYESFYQVTSIFENYISGVQTKKDAIAIDFTRQELIYKLQDLLKLETQVVREKYKLGADSSGWTIDKAKKNLQDYQPLKNYIVPITYRPFDFRYTWYTNRSSGLLGRPRYSIMRNMTFQDNLGLITMRQTVNSEYSHFGVTNKIACHGTFYLGNKGQDYVFPLYLYPDPRASKELQQEKRSNFSPDFLKIIKSKLGYLPIPETIFYYIYGVFHSPTYRTRYAEFLKIDFPRVPLTSNNNLFTQLAEYGEQLVQLHLMESPLLNRLITRFKEKGGKCTVEAGHPKYISGTVIINKKGDRFVDVPEDVWNFYVGGYQPCQKWLKDRKGRQLSDEDILHYQKIVVALQETIRLMQLIDNAIPSFPIE